MLNQWKLSSLRLWTLSPLPPSRDSCPPGPGIGSLLGISLLSLFKGISAAPSCTVNSGSDPLGVLRSCQQSGPGQPNPLLTFLIAVVKGLPGVGLGVSAPEREGRPEQSGSCSVVSSHPGGEARAQPVQAKNRKQVDFAEVQMGMGREEAHVRALGGAGWNEKVSLLRSQAGEPGGPQLGFGLPWDKAVN